MNTTIIDKCELYNVIQFVNLISVRFEDEGAWLVAPVLYVAEDSIEIFFNGNKSSVPAHIGDSTLFKFQRGHNEYYVSGEIRAIGETCPASILINYNEITKCDNLRQHTRFESCISQAIVRDESGEEILGCVKNISLGGMLVSMPKSFEAGCTTNMEIKLNTENVIKVFCKLVRKVADGDNSYFYGVQFVDILDKGLRILEIEIAKMEMEKFKSLKLLRKKSSLGEDIYPDKIAIISYDEGESYEVREALVRLGAENFDIFHDFKYYADYFNDINPKIIIIDTSVMNDFIKDIIMKVNRNYKDKYIVLLFPFEFYKSGDSDGFEEQSNSILYKPFVFNEFEEEITKYL